MKFFPFISPVPEFVPRIRIWETDMPPDVQDFAIEMVTYAVDNFAAVGEMANYIESNFDDKYGGKWQCIVGNAFGLHVAHIAGTLMFLYDEELAVLIYKTSELECVCDQEDMSEAEA